MPEPTESTSVVPQPSLLVDTEATCQVLLIRHGRSADVVPGSPEAADPGLHPLGVEQAARLAARLRGRPLQAVYSSHLARAVETARPLAEERGLPVVQIRDLEEVRLGRWANGEFRRRAAIRDPEWVAWSRTGRWEGIPGGEHDDALRHRVRTTVHGLAERHRGATIAVVAHSGTINAFVADAVGSYRSIIHAVENTSITLVRVGPDGTTIVTVNDCRHLDDPAWG